MTLVSWAITLRVCMHTQDWCATTTLAHGPCLTLSPQNPAPPSTGQMPAYRMATCMQAMSRCLAMSPAPVLQPVHWS